MKLRKRQKKIAVLLLVFVCLMGLSFGEKRFGWNLPLITSKQVNGTTPALVAGTYKVVSFDDGDTIVVDMNGTSETVRFIGVDTPEVKDPRKPVQCFGRAASDFTKNLIGSNPVRLEADPENTNRDRYNRLLRYIYLPDGKLINAEIIKQGYGFAYTAFPFTKKEEFKAYETQARDANKGLWGGCSVGIDEKGRRTINSETNP